LITQWTIFVIILISNAVLAGAIAILLNRRYSAPGRNAMIWMMAGLAVWAFGYAMIIISPPLEVKIFWLRFENLGILTVPVFWFFFTVQYAQMDNWLNRNTGALFFIIPLISLLFVFSDRWVHLYYSSVRLLSENGGPLVIERGPWYLVSTIQVYLLNLTGMGVLIWRFFYYRSIYRRQLGILIGAVLIPLVVSVFYQLAPRIIPTFSLRIDLTPISFTLTAFLLSVGVLGLRLFDLIPIARHTVLEHIPEMVFVVDAHDRLLDANSVAQKSLGKSLDEIIGRDTLEVFHGWPQLINRFFTTDEMHEEIQIPGDPPRMLEVDISPLYNQLGRLGGRIIVAHDITEHKWLENALKYANESLKNQLDEINTLRDELQGRLDELNRLLVASQGIASTLKLDEALDSILRAIVDSGASSAQIMLVRDIIPMLVDIPLRYSSGPEKDSYIYLDQQILSLTLQQERPMMATLSQIHGLEINPSLPNPESLFAITLRHENRDFGVLWAAYKKQKVFSESDVRFITTLASQTVLAVANIRLFLEVDAGRRQLETILNSTPDPVLVTDASDCLILANPAASQLFDMTIRRGERQDLHKVVQLEPFYDLLQESSEDSHTSEINMLDGKTYLATASAMVMDGRIVGHVCIMRDITSRRKLYEEMERRFLVSEKMASSQHINDASRWILESLLSSGAKNAQIILSPNEFQEPRLEFSLSYRLGPLSDSYSPFDNNILEFNKSRGDGLFKTSDLNLGFFDEPEQLEKIYSIKVNGKHCGVVWLTYDNFHDFTVSEEDFLRFMIEKASQTIGNFKQYLESKYPRNEMGELNYVSSIFLSHSSKDNNFAENLKKQLEKARIKVWLDNAELKMGEPLLERIDKAIKDNEYVGAILSSNSIYSKWVQKELDLAIDKEMKSAKYITIPVLLETVELPPHLRGKVYVDFTVPDKISYNFKKWVESMGGVIDDVTDIVNELLRAKYRIDDSEDTIITNPFKLRLVHIPVFGLSSNNNDESRTDKDFWIDKYPITNSQFREFVLDSKYNWQDEYGTFKSGFDDHPVVGVSLYDAEHFCKWLSKRSGYRFRLPTEREWDRAYRIPEAIDWKFPWGNEFYDDRLNWQGGPHKTTTRVGFYSPAGDSVFGVSDLAGNVWEWCDNNSTEFGILRGGAYSSNSRQVLFDSRKEERRKMKFVDTGFRVVLIKDMS